MSSANARQAKADRTDAAARAIIDAEFDAREKKTAKLRRLRLMRQAKAAAAPAAAKPRAKAKPRSAT